MTTRYLADLKQAVTGDATTPLVFLCDFEVEQQWARAFPGLPAPAFSLTGRLVTRMEELGALLAGPDDCLVLQHPLDAGFIGYARDLGFDLPTTLITDGGEPDQSTSARATRSPAVLDHLRDWGRRGARLLPMGLSQDEVDLAAAAGLPLATPELATVVRVNSKIYSRRLVAATGLRPVPGWCCETVDEFAALMAKIGPDCTQSAPVVVKDAYGVSGKGLVVVDDPAKAARLVRAATARARRRADPRLHVVVETWLPKRADLNYQFTIDGQGAVRLDFVKEALTAGGVHLGHLSPAELDDTQLADVRQAAEVVGKALHADGFTGVVGVDAIVAADGLVYPVLEINARFNMSTYQGGVLERLAAGRPASLAGHHVLRLSRPVTFAEIHAALGPLTAIDSVAGGVVITCFGTVNAMAPQPPGESFEGRLYFIAIGPDRAAVTAHADTARRALEGIQ